MFVCFNASGPTTIVWEFRFFKIRSGLEYIKTFQKAICRVQFSTRNFTFVYIVIKIIMVFTTTSLVIGTILHTFQV